MRVPGHHPWGAGVSLQRGIGLGGGACQCVFWVSHATVFRGAWQYLLLVRDEMTVSHKHLGEFCSSLKQYLKSVAGERDCFQWVPPADVQRGGRGGRGCPAALTARSTPPSEGLRQTSQDLGV